MQSRLLLRGRNCLRFLYTQRFQSTTTVKTEEVYIDKLDNESRGIFVLSLNKPKTKNALSKHLVNLLFDKLHELRTNKELRVLILRSAVSGVFCAGADLKERLKMPLNEVEPFVSTLRSLANTIHEFEWPTICAFDGIALGGGLEIGLSCDLRVATESAKLGLVETKLAIIPGAAGTQTLSRLVGPAIAKELIFTARVMDGKEARDYGIVNHVVSQNDKGTAAFEKAVYLANQMLPNGPKALRMAKLAVNKGLEVDFTTGLAIERLCYGQLITTSDRVEGLQAFLEKRPPNYTGD
ncbi:methylglutaconyl-CoA hydratase-like protein [Leptotrombidium deliense]|uniref:Methylglutaconyl-CoA hydratase-like protein n=1 Tax=Leptotrombidium deliense TaxID=299467 RepID=A0A443SUX7_9ACAR|nr:methylglutaconyl-CoA hydratase-like protein [Leptotrombidium deliense]